MLEKLAQIEKNYEDLTAQISSPEIMSDMKTYAKTMKQHNSLEEVVFKYREVKKMTEALAGAKEILELSDDDMQRVIGINLLATMALTQEAAKAMVRVGSGSIIIIGSINEDRVIPEQGHYCASKGGLRQWGRALAASLGPSGVRVNLLCPGAIDTPMNQAHLAAHPERRATIIERTPLRRLGEPTDLAAAAAFLASDESRFMTGASLFVDGGLSFG